MLAYLVFGMNDEIDFEICLASTREKAIELTMQLLAEDGLTPENIMEDLSYDIYIQEYEIDTLRSTRYSDDKNKRFFSSKPAIITPEVIERYQHMDKKIS